MKVLCPLCIVLCCYSLVQAQQRPSYGVLTQLSANIHASDFRSLPGVPSCCPRYGSGFGIGSVLGVQYQYPLGDENLSIWRLSLRGILSTTGGDLVRDENITLSGNTQGLFEHRVQATLWNVGVEPLIEYAVGRDLWLSAGIQGGIVFRKSFSQKEIILEPSNGTFEGGKRSRNVVENAPLAQGQSLTTGLRLGVSYDLKLNKESTLIMAPELMMCLPLSNVVHDVDWKVWQIRGGVSVKWAPPSIPTPIKRREEREEVDTIYRSAPIATTEYRLGIEQRSEQVLESETEERTIITIRRSDTLVSPLPAQQKLLSAQLWASGVEKDGSETPVVRITVEEFASALVTTPLLPYVFFEESSSDIPQRYRSLDKEGLEQFIERQLPANSRIETYHTLLNIVGKRLQLHTKATITLVGCNDGTTKEKSNVSLSRNRAESVKSYLVHNCGVAAERIKVVAANLPDKAASGSSENAMQENRRVELYSDNSEILAPIIIKDTLRIVNPPTVRFHNTVRSDTALASWHINIRQGGEELKNLSGKGAIAEVIDWQADKEENKPRSNEAIECVLSVSDEAHNTTSAFCSIMVEQITMKQKLMLHQADLSVQKYSILLFDIRSSEINPSNLPYLEMMRNTLQPDSKVTITGYSDRLGDARTNQALAMERAEATAKALGISKSSINMRGVGNADLYDATLPEGRLYSRTVDIVIETPIPHKKQP